MHRIETSTASVDRAPRRPAGRIAQLLMLCLGLAGVVTGIQQIRSGLAPRNDSGMPTLVEAQAVAVAAKTELTEFVNSTIGVALREDARCFELARELLL